MTFSLREESRTLGEPINLYLFKGADPTIESLLRSVTIIPGTTEFGYGTTKVTKDGFPSNHIANLPVTDFEAALNDLTATATDLTHVSLVVAWHGSDLRCGECKIRPKAENASAIETYNWQVGPVLRSNAQMVSRIDDRPAIGGAPADRSVYEALLAIKARGLKVTLYPLVMMDIPQDNTLPSPYGGSSQPAYPWRGRITCHPAPGQPGTVDKTADAVDQVNAFFGTVAVTSFSFDARPGFKVVGYGGPANEWSYRRFILHMAMIGAAAGVDDFLIGSELVGLTSIRGPGNTFPAVTKLVELAADVRYRLGVNARISYGADWSEYHSYRPSDGSGDVFFHLDPLWASPDIDYVGIDNYLPIADWRNGTNHLDRIDGRLSGHEKAYLQANIEGGEYFDWYYASQEERSAQIRRPIWDSAHDEPWIYGNKNIRGWWSSPHHNRVDGERVESPTAWAPMSKPIVFTELGCPAVNKGANQPNVFVDPKSSESHYPHFSNGVRDETIQRAFLEAVLDYWNPKNGINPTSPVYGGPMVQWNQISVWTWDARPNPTFPQRADMWGDAANWSVGHWINGRIQGGQDFAAGNLGPYAYTDAEKEVVKDGITYKPIPIQRGAITSSGSLDKAMIEVTMSQGENVGDLFIAYPPAQVLNLIIYQGHVGDDPDSLNSFPVVWTGRVLGAQHPPNETKFTCEPVSTSMQRPGLRRNYQIPCPHVLYGSQCRANRKRATSVSQVVSASGNRVTLQPNWFGARPSAKYVGGMLGWTKPGGTRELRSIMRIEGNTLLLSGIIRDLPPGTTVDVMLGCNRNMGDCRNLHDNILNFGGQPWIPLQNPLGFVNNFY